MDPYLEDPDIWSGFHTPLFVELMQQLNEILPTGYQAKVGMSQGAVHGVSERWHEGNRYVKVLDRARNRVVTVIEVLSPSNKTTGQDREAYLMKRNEYLGAGVNVVELDLLRGGQRMPWGESQPPDASYYIMVSRNWEFPRAGVWPLSLRDTLPFIPIPLAENVAELVLPLQECFDAAYRKGRHADEIDYTQLPNPPLSEVDAPWARKRIEEWMQCDA